MQDRPYQTQGIEQILEQYKQGYKKVLLHLGTGGGKTYMFSKMIKGAVEKGNSSIMVVRGRELVEQASARLFREDVQHGVRMANHWNKRYSAPVQVCSIDTLMARKEFPPAKFVVVDEAHLFTSPRCVEFMNYYSASFVLAVTATPYTDKSLRHLADVIVNPISFQGMVDGGWLLPARVFAPSTPDLTGVRTQNGDFANLELEERMGTLTGDLVHHWRTIGENRATINFAVNIHHSLAIVERFNRAGIRAEHIEGNTPDSQRKAAIARLKCGETKILSNVGVLCTGVDLPFVSCIIMARPTKSYTLYIQQAGRGTRVCPEIGKRDFILLDHAGNTLRHGFINENREGDLDGRERKFRELNPKTCLQCFAIYAGANCESCGPVARPDSGGDRIVEEEEGVLEEIKHLPEAIKISQFVARCKDIQKRRGYKPQWIYHQVKEKYGNEIANQVKLSRPVPAWLRRGT